MAPQMLTDWSQIEAKATGRIAFLVRGLHGGGAQRDAILLANALERQGHASAIVTLDSSGDMVRLVDERVPIFDLGGGRKLRMALAAGAVRRLLTRGRPSAFISSEAAANVLTAILSRTIPARRRPRIILREVAAPLAARSGDPYWQNRLAYRLVPHVYPWADRIVTLTRGAADELIERFGIAPAKVVVLGSNAVLTPNMRARIAGLARTPEPGHVVSVGRLSPEKRFATLIEAFVRLRRQRPAHLTILGDGPERAALETLIAARGLERDVTLAGHYAQPLDVLARAALYVCASAHEGLGNAIIEAMAMGVPVVSTDAPHGPREILRDGLLGRLVAVDKAEALAAAMAAALDEPMEASALQARAADFTSEAAAAKFAALLEQAPSALTSERAGGRIDTGLGWGTG